MALIISGSGGDGLDEILNAHDHRSGVAAPVYTKALLIIFDSLQDAIKLGANGCGRDSIGHRFLANSCVVRHYPVRFGPKMSLGSPYESKIYWRRSISQRYCGAVPLGCSGIRVLEPIDLGL
jgi:hypothetical protein